MNNIKQIFKTKVILIILLIQSCSINQSKISSQLLGKWNVVEIYFPDTEDYHDDPNGSFWFKNEQKCEVNNGFNTFDCTWHIKGDQVNVFGKDTISLRIITIKSNELKASTQNTIITLMKE